MALLRAREIIMQPIRPKLKNIGLTEQKWRVLRALEEAGEVEQTTLAQNAALLLPSLTRILQTLEDDGLINRKQDPGDKRRSLVSIAGEGRKLVRENLNMADELFETLEARFGQERLELLLDLLEELQTTDLASEPA